MGSRLNWEINNKRNIRISEFNQKEVLHLKLLKTTFVYKYLDYLYNTLT